jgi:hypothetical protein
MSVRLPTILGKGIADVHQTLNQEVSLKRLSMQFSHVEPYVNSRMKTVSPISSPAFTEWKT